LAISSTSSLTFIPPVPRWDSGCESSLPDRRSLSGQCSMTSSTLLS
jgi:hypothetical protein